jgi:hypothetical protein
MSLPGSDALNPPLPGFIPASSRVVWNMEKIPPDLGGAGWTNDQNSGYGVAAGHVGWRGENGKGFDKTRALKWTGFDSWTDTRPYRHTYVDLRKDDNASKNWSGGVALWFWLDTSSLKGFENFFITLSLNKTYPAKNTVCTIYPGDVPKPLSIINEWGDTAALGPYTGWIRIPLSAFSDVDLSAIEYFGFNCETDAGVNPGSLSVYFDHFVIEEEEVFSAPAVEYPPLPSYIPISRVFLAWNMEKLPADLVTSGWVSDQYTEHGVGAGSVGWKREGGKGYGASQALKWIGYEDWTDYQWARHTYIDLRNDRSAVRDWSGCDALWFWIDTYSMDGYDDFRMTLTINKEHALKDSMMSIFPGGKEEVLFFRDWGETAPLLSYKGWIRMPLDAFPNIDLSNVEYFGFNCSTGWWSVDPGDKAIYLDQFLIEKTGTPPPPPSHPAPLPSYIPEEKVTIAWDMENLPPVLGSVSGWTADAWEYLGVAAGYVGWLGSEGKGFGNSKALAWISYEENGWTGGNWGRVTYVNLYRDKTALRNWTGKKALWIWVDTTAMAGYDINYKISINDMFPVTGTAIGIYPNGVAGSISVLNDSGDLKIPAYKGWIRIPLDSFSSLDLSKIRTLGLNCNGINSTAPVNIPVYFDHFLLETE